jgi:hypothetical protein
MYTNLEHWGGHGLPALILIDEVDTTHELLPPTIAVFDIPEKNHDNVFN